METGVKVYTYIHFFTVEKRKLKNIHFVFYIRINKNEDTKKIIYLNNIFNFLTGYTI